MMRIGCRGRSSSGLASNTAIAEGMTEGQPRHLLLLLLTRTGSNGCYDHSNNRHDLLEQRPRHLAAAAACDAATAVGNDATSSETSLLHPGCVLLCYLALLLALLLFVYLVATELVLSCLMEGIQCCYCY